MDNKEIEKKICEVLDKIRPSVTLEDGIESALINEIPEVVKVVNED